MMTRFAIIWLGSLGLFCIFMTAAFSQELKDPGRRGSGRIEKKAQIFDPGPVNGPTSSGSSGTR